jgi:hypothetical protein
MQNFNRINNILTFTKLEINLHFRWFYKLIQRSLNVNAIKSEKYQIVTFCQWLFNHAV